MCRNDYYSKSICLAKELNEARKELAQVRSERDSVTLVLMRDIESDSIVASCECMTKTNEVRLHKPGCKYRLISERDDARAELAALKAAQNQTPMDRPDRAGWLPIETAPKDGTHIIIAEESNKGFWFQEDWWIDDETEWQYATDPIGWMPLPATPPRAIEEGTE
jgi:hypothetical protein